MRMKVRWCAGLTGPSSAGLQAGSRGGVHAWRPRPQFDSSASCSSGADGTSAPTAGLEAGATLSEPVAVSNDETLRNGYRNLTAESRSRVFTHIEGADASMPAAFMNAKLHERQRRAKDKQEKISVVVVDDSRPYQEVISSLLEEEYRFHVVGRGDDGTEAVKAVAELHPQLVLMDVNMPRMNGLKAATLLAERFPEVKIILMSGEDTRCLRETCLACGAHAFVGKQHFREDLAIAVGDIGIVSKTGAAASSLARAGGTAPWGEG